MGGYAGFHLIIELTIFIRYDTPTKNKVIDKILIWKNENGVSFRRYYVVPSR